MSEEQIRAEFEAWYRGKFCKTLSGMATDEMMYIGSNGEYSSFHVRGAWEGWQAAIASQSKNALPNQEPLGSEFEKVLYENLDSLYETDVATQLPTNDKEMINCHYEHIVVDGSEESDAGVRPVLVPNGFKIVNDNQPTDERVRELEKDAARYRWLRDKPTWSISQVSADFRYIEPGCLRELPNSEKTNLWSVEFNVDYGFTEEQDSLDEAIDKALASMSGEQK